MGTGIAISEYEGKAIVAMHKEGKTPKEISAVIGRPDSSIHGYLARTGFIQVRSRDSKEPSRRESDDIVAELRAIHGVLNRILGHIMRARAVSGEISSGAVPANGQPAWNHETPSG